MTGIQPVENLEIRTIYDRHDSLLTRFREKVIAEKNSPEDNYKFSNAKWDKLNLFAIEAIIENDEIIGISGCGWYGNYLRTSMNLYILKPYRSKYPGVKYIKNGWFDRHIRMAEQWGGDGLFFTVYAYSKKLKALIANHGKKTISLVDKKHLLYMDKIKEKGEYIFNSVPQTFFYYPITKTIDEFDPNEFEEVIPKG